MTELRGNKVQIGFGISPHRLHVAVNGVRRNGSNFDQAIVADKNGITINIPVNNCGLRRM